MSGATGDRPSAAWFKALAETSAAQLQCSPEVVINGNLDEVPPLIARHARAAAAELLHNAIAHSHASALILYVCVGDGHVEVRVSDDGIGTEVALGAGAEGYQERAPRVGLDRLAARALELNGSFSITPTADRGCIARWRVPLPSRVRDG
jgi:signal transduction histidine kinase